ncbi:hypothetical protein EDB19DRAFT_1910685 [Suillus lakei]|nr:hypothetical protein EDB19DRAFT_1910685 [Suillus lakei]
MSSRQPRDRASRSSASHPHFTPSSAHSQGLASPNASTTPRQPTRGAWTSTSTPSSRSVPEGGATQETSPSSQSTIIRDERDFSLALSIQAAQGDSRECPWYGVWSKVLQSYIFREADGSQTACTCIPQYSLVASHDSGRLPQSGNSGWSDSDIAMGSPSPDRHLVTPGLLPGPPSAPYNPTPDFSPRSQVIFEGSLSPVTPSPLLTTFPRFVSDLGSPTAQYAARLQARRAGDAPNLPVSTRPLPQPSSSSSYHYPPDGILPVTPPRPTTGLPDASFRIPDFVQILEHAQQPFPVVPGHVIRRVIMTVEIKPEPRVDKTFNWESIWKDQVREQVLHAFEADRTLQYLGVIMAAGRRWVYGTVRREARASRTMSEKRDPTFVPSPDDSRLKEWPSLDRPDFVPKTKHGTMHEFNLLDAGGESLRVFEEIFNDLRRKNSDIWF